jgi:hypothetical protein
LTASYSFIASSTGNQQSNLIAARDVVASGVVSSTFLSFPLNNKQTSNFYKFSLSSGQQTNITMTPHNILAKMRVLQDANSDHAIVLDDEIVSSTAPSGSQQTLTVKRPGDYYLQVSQPFPVLSDSPSFTTDVKFQFSALN